MATAGLVRRHPLQRLPAPSRGASAILHSLGLASFAYSFSWLVRNPNPVNDSYGWHMQYLTIIGLSLAAATFTVALLADITDSHTLFKIKNALAVASAPMECLISLLYWTLRAIDESLVLPDWAEPLPLHTDFSFHAIPALALVIDILFFSPPYTIAVLPALALSGCIAFGYWVWIERCYQFNQFYPYPLFEILSTPQRVGLFASSALLMTGVTMLLISLYGLLNGRDTIISNGGATRKMRSGNVKGE
ncbi:FAR-17a/AIG1-like protein [Neohortaea acidophila]|uniref:FAR-17a/AIG1-like protein n=1 Tax=Neohortaea acidophila TaxID=245834 RepID=A0A6A6PNH6_9PEZI|nr:FAR-17a/AIG1-like protein [Neohortaea acidophila]KAF2480817.1 FAR-17a/AIG1-like protein [Neohortaea acidophila]